MSVVHDYSASVVHDLAAIDICALNLGFLL